MNNITTIASRIQSFGRPNRSGVKSISHQTVYLRTATLAEDSILETNISGIQEDYLKSLFQRPEARNTIQRLGEHYLRSVTKTEESIFSMTDTVPTINSFLSTVQGALPKIFDISLEIRPAPLLSHSVHYYVSMTEDDKVIEDHVRRILNEYNVPSEAVNIVLRLEGTVSHKEMTHLMTVMSVLLREMAFAFSFIPGRVIGTFAMITE